MDREMRMMRRSKEGLRGTCRDLYTRLQIRYHIIVKYDTIT